MGEAFFSVLSYFFQFNISIVEKEGELKNYDIKMILNLYIFIYLSAQTSLSVEILTGQTEMWLEKN